MTQAQINHFLTTLNRSPKTIRSYKNAINQFVIITGGELTVENYTRFLHALHDHSPTTQKQYRTAVRSLYNFIGVGDTARMDAADRHYISLQGDRVVNFDREGIERVIQYCEKLRDSLLALRDRAFVLTLVDTGLRISEACSLKRGDIDWREQRAVIVGKGDKQAVVRFSNRAIAALKEYLQARASIDTNSRSPLASQPVFARHDKSASKKIKRVVPSGMRKAIKGDPARGVVGRIAEAGVDRNSIRIHDFRHYFVTVTYLASGDLKISQELARHKSIQTTNRYAHLGGALDEAYDRIFNKK